MRNPHSVKSRDTRHRRRLTWKQITLFADKYTCFAYEVFSKSKFSHLSHFHPVAISNRCRWPCREDKCEFPQYVSSLCLA